jgi:tRNA (cytidine32/guanosine34-2'-O)-methyltransferase
LVYTTGSWSQVVKQRLEYKALDLQKNPSDNVIVAVDLQEMAPIEGVIQIKGDITCTFHL